MSEHTAMGTLLLREGLLTEEELNSALEVQKSQGGRLGYHLIRMGYVNVERLSQFLRESMGLIPYNLNRWITDESVLDTLPANIAQFYQVIPVERRGDVLTVAIADLDNPSIIPAIEELTGLSIDPVVCPRETIVNALERFYGVAKDPGVVRSLSGDHLFILSSRSPRIRPLHWSVLKPDSSATDWLRTILAEAIRTGCRTLYINPGEKNLKISFKRPDKVEDRFGLHPKKREEMDALLRELARIREHRRGGRIEGRVRLQAGSRFMTLYVKGIPTLQGTRYTLTLYDEKVFSRNWTKLAGQLGEAEGASLNKALHKTPGLVIMSGPPGPGMYQVYYSLLSHLASRGQAAVALEEYSMLAIENTSQVEVSREEGATWPELIATALKQDPELFTCFPVKERMSMELIMLAASHTRVLAVLHQPDALAALRWLWRNNFRSPLRAGVLKGILTVASLPALCPDCKLPVRVSGRSGGAYSLFTRQGCEKCLTWESLHSVEILEWIPLGEESRGLFEDEPTAEELHRRIAESGGTNLGERVLNAARRGLVDGHELGDYLP